ncbi:hypothetical protein F511_22706 [Dorcoceras hygrometricum]|uniref:No apical meristem-associated C-terminal domain-containing protein n=1 Tax=Dorcoceras hygrometricum TaxID=472368 RepID=A0A2Z7BYL4_9LAMI|nr:hypothetical protein F511_22706 [Dorcoceras hygrometricum]
MAKANPRNTNFTREEDIHLAHVYLGISQDPFVGINQSRDRLWDRVTSSYNSSKPNSSMSNRTMHQAREAQDKSFKKGFKMDHVWPLLKDLDFDSKAPTPESDIFHSAGSPQSGTPTSASPGLSSFSINLSDDTTPTRPDGVKKSKKKRINNEDTSAFFDLVKEENRQLREAMEKSSNVQMRKLELAEMREENKIIFMDLNSISDPTKREFLRAEQARLMQKRNPHGPGSCNTSNTFGDYFPDIGGCGNDLPPY